MNGTASSPAGPARPIPIDPSRNTAPISGPSTVPSELKPCNSVSRAAARRDGPTTVTTVLAAICRKVIPVDSVSSASSTSTNERHSAEAISTRHPASITLSPTTIDRIYPMRRIAIAIGKANSR